MRIGIGERYPELVDVRKNNIEEFPALAELLEMATRHNLVRIKAYASGSGDSGSVHTIEYFRRGIDDTVEAEDQLSHDDEEEANISEVFSDAVYAAFEENGHDYYNNDGGQLELNLDVRRRLVYWESAYMLMSDPEATEFRL